MGPKTISGIKSNGNIIQNINNGVKAKNILDIKLRFGSSMYLRQAFIKPTRAVF